MPFQNRHAARQNGQARLGHPDTWTFLKRMSVSVRVCPEDRRTRVIRFGIGRAQQAKSWELRAAMRGSEQPRAADQSERTAAPATRCNDVVGASLAGSASSRLALARLAGEAAGAENGQTNRENAGAPYVTMLHEAGSPAGFPVAWALDRTRRLAALPRQGQADWKALPATRLRTTSLPRVAGAVVLAV